MARFKFELQALLKAKLAIEQQRQIQTAKIEAERRQLEERLRAQQQQFATSRDEQQRALVGRVDAHLLRMRAAASMHMMREAQRIVLELAGAHKRLQAAQTALLEASRQRKALELLRDRRFEEWRAAQNRIEDAAIDELAVISAARRLRSDQA